MFCLNNSKSKLQAIESINRDLKMAETAEQNEQQDHSEPSSAQFECNICLDTAKDAVISYCGHLFWYV